MPKAKLKPDVTAFEADQRQQEAIEHLHGPMLVIAGAGTGKTTVLTRRIARLISERHARPDEILALTYTENAAAEMRTRVRAELGGGSNYILDPDFGVVVPYDTAAIQANPELVRAPYSNMAALYYPDAKEPYTTDIMVNIFGKRKYVYTVDNWFEYFSYWAIWIIPVLLMLPYFLVIVKRR